MITSKSVHVTNLEKVYESANKQIVAVNKVSIDILPGEFVTLLGPSGCGKTTILRMIAGFEKPTGGDIYINKEKVTSLTPDKRDTSMVFQSYALFPHLSVFENIAYGLRIKKLPTTTINEKVMAILELVGLAGMENRNPNQLSGGQQQRVALARSLVMEPGVLLFDEPLSNLDAKLRIHMRAEIRKIQQKIGITTVYVTHDQAEAMSMSDRVIVMNKGNIEQIGTPSDIYNKPSSQFVADFIGLANIFDAEVVAVSPGTATVRCLEAIFSVSTDLELQPGNRVKAVFRPEAASLSETGKIAAKVETSVFMGSYQDYKLSVGSQSCIILEYNPMHKKIFAPGDNVFLNLNEQSLHLVKS